MRNLVHFLNKSTYWISPTVGNWCPFATAPHCMQTPPQPSWALTSCLRLPQPLLSPRGSATHLNRVRHPIPSGHPPLPLWRCPSHSHMDSTSAAWLLPRSDVTFIHSGSNLPHWSGLHGDILFSLFRHPTPAAFLLGCPLFSVQALTFWPRPFACMVKLCLSHSLPLSLPLCSDCPPWEISSVFLLSPKTMHGPLHFPSLLLQPQGCLPCLAHLKTFKLNCQKEYKGRENQRRGEGGGEGRDLPGNFLLKGGHGVWQV